MHIELIEKDYPYQHWQYLNLETGDRLRIVPERGGLISEWLCNNKEILYFDINRFESNEKSVRGGIPVLFPICGDLPNNCLSLSQGNFTINQHGFARDLPWQIKVLEEQDGISLSLFSNEKTLESFPFHFFIEMRIILQKNGLFIKTFINNVGQQKMPFSFGFHPYFGVSDLNNIVIRGLSKRCTNHIDMKIVSTDSQLAKLSQGVDFLTSFETSVSFFDLASQSGIEMQTDSPMDLAVIWTNPPRQMVCMEPWTSPRGSLSTGQRRLFLEPGKSQELVCKFISL